MRLKLFKMFESRTSELSKEEFIRILQDKCKDYIKTPKLLQRSKSIQSAVFSYINPKVHERNPGGGSTGVSVSSKHHILLMDNLPSWSKFPKRSQSIIGVTMEDPRSLFGSEKYLVIPFDGAKFGVAPSADLWSCDVVIQGRRFSFDNSFAVMFLNNDISDNSYSEMMSDLQKLYDAKYEEKRPESFLGGDGTSLWHLMSKEVKDSLGLVFKQAREDGIEKIEDAINLYFAPSQFHGTDIDDMHHFNTMDWRYISNLNEYDFYEFWTESECLLYYIGNLHAGSDIERAYHEFLDEFIK